MQIGGPSRDPSPNRSIDVPVLVTQAIRSDASCGSALAAASVRAEVALPEALQGCGVEEQAPDESRHRSQAEHAARQRELVSREQQLAAREQELGIREVELQAGLRERQRELVSREQQLAAREQELASREVELQAGLRDREQRILGRERRCADREEQLADQERRLVDRETQVLGREKRLADREADLAERWERFATRREEFEILNSELEQLGSRLRGEEEKMKEWRRQLDERELRWSEACNENHLIKHYHPKRRLSPRSGKENQELQRQLEEQQSRMHEIKRQSGSWSPDPGYKGGPGLPFPVTPPAPPIALGESKSQRCYAPDPGNKGGSGLPFPVTPPALGESKSQRCYGSDLGDFAGMGR